MSKRKIHMRDRTYYVNAGMRMPLCYARQRGLLDTDKSRLPTTGDIQKVTCEHCKREYRTNH